MRFDPHPWLAGGHLMTMGGALAQEWPRRFRVVEDEVREVVVDAATSVIVKLRWQPDRRAAPLLVLTHGLTGDAEVGYMRGTADKAFARGFSVARINVRNCGGTEHLTETLYHSGLTDDLRAVVRELISRDGVRRVYLAGFSMGGNITLKLAGEGLPEEVRGVMAVSPPISLSRACAAIERGAVNAYYQRRFLRDLKAVLQRRAARGRGASRPDVRGLDGVRTLRAFDERYTAPCFGFGGAEVYYARASALPLLPAVKVPALILAARDDSIIPCALFESPEVRAMKDLTLVVSDRGGHNAFVGRAPFKSATWEDADRFWAENRIVQFASELDAKR